MQRDFELKDIDCSGRSENLKTGEHIQSEMQHKQLGNCRKIEGESIKYYALYKNVTKNSEAGQIVSI